MHPKFSYTPKKEKAQLLDFYFQGKENIFMKIQ